MAILAAASALPAADCAPRRLEHLAAFGRVQYDPEN
jgi:hypothetical protein